MTESEKYIAELNSNFFFKEFTYSSTKFKFDDRGQQLELADNVVWLDDLLLISQIKERNVSSDSDPENWFKNKVLKKAVAQIKNTISYFDQYKEISIPNEKGHILNISEARKIEPIKLIIYAPGNQFPEKLRFQKFYKSKEIGYVQLFHIEDYLWICKYLITPFEIREYLNFRELLFRNHEKELDSLPEQYILGHYIETLDTSTLNLRYIENLKKLVHDENEFDISYIIENFKEKLRVEQDSLDYYAIIKELAKLNRADLREFKKRYLLTIEKSKKQEFTLPYRITSLNSKCGFVFVPLEYEHRNKCHNALINFTEAHKYEQKLDKCVGMIVYQHLTEKYFDINWCYSESKWEYDEEFERLLNENFPFRSVKMGKTFRYYIDNK